MAQGDFPTKASIPEFYSFIFEATAKIFFCASATMLSCKSAVLFSHYF
jgi:hypothetical protein